MFIRSGILVLCGVAGLFFAQVARGEVCVKELPGADGTRQVVMENATLKLAINPALGGRVSSFVWKPAGADWVLPGNAGVLMDHVWQQTWPGELLGRAYEVVIVKAGPDVGVVEASVTIDGRGDKQIEGVKLIRTMTLTGDSPRLDVKMRLENPTGEPRSPGLWVQNVFNVGGVREGPWTWRPSTRGVISAYYDSKAGGCVPPNLDFLYDPTAGWNAETHPEKREGVVLLMDYNWLRCLYNNSGSVSLEWWYDQSPLGSGKSFETGFTVWPFRGLKTVTYADHALVAGLRMEESSDGLLLVNEMVAGPDGAGGPVDARLELLDYDTGEAIHAEVFKGVAIGDKVAEQKAKAPKVAATRNILSRTTVTMPDGKSRMYEIYRAGAAVMGTERQYKIKRPERVRAFERPAVIAKTPHEGVRILHLRGLFEHAYRLAETAKIMGAELKTGSYTTFVYGPGLSYFPTEYAELMGFDVIVLNNVPAEVIDDRITRFLTDYVEHGGVLLAIGGHWAFGGGGYKDSKLEELLPVKSSGPYDVLPLEGGKLTPTPAKDLAVGTRWYQNVTARPEAEVTVRAGEKPFWVQWKRGKGTAIVLVGLAYGESTDKLLLFNEWEGWPNWLAERLKTAIQETGK